MHLRWLPIAPLALACGAAPPTEMDSQPLAASSSVASSPRADDGATSAPSEPFPSDEAWVGLDDEAEAYADSAGETTEGSTTALSAPPAPTSSNDTSKQTGGAASDGTGFTLDPSEVTEPPGETADPPPGETGDPPPGETGDPPPGETGDPPPGETGDPPPGETGDPPPGDTGDPPGRCKPSGIDQVNVIVFETAAPSGADTLGGMYVGGDADLVNYAVGSGLTKDCSRLDLVVGGTLEGSPVVNNGLATYGELPAPAGSFGCGAERATPVDFESLRDELESYSQALTEYEPNGETQVAFSAITLVGSDPALNIFEVTSEQLREATSFSISVPDGSSVLVNISGAYASWTNCGFTLPDGNGSCISGSSSWCHRILYNFHEAETLRLDGIGVQGSVLAPYASLNPPDSGGPGGGNVDGQVIVKALYGNTEYHDFYFTGCLVWPDQP